MPGGHGDVLTVHPGIPATGTEDALLGGTLRLTWVTDHLAHALRHSDSEAGETSGTWTGLACPWPANYPVLELMQGSGLTQFSPAKPQRW